MIIACLKQLEEDHLVSNLDDVNEETRLSGAKSPLDSISLVNLIADLEGMISERFGEELILADERAFNQRISPFARVSTLADYIENLIEEHQVVV